MRRILVIDDDDAVRAAVSKTLKIGGFEPIEAHDGRDGLDVFIRHTFVAVITDLFMPEKEGIETIQRIKELEPTVPVIAISGSVDFSFSALEDARLIGADATVEKPFSVEGLLEVVNGVLAHTNAPPAVRPLAPDRTRKVLVIDDDNEVRALMCAMLKRDGTFEVIDANSGQDGVSEFMRHDFSAVVTDLVMPGQSGVETIRRLRALREEIPIVAVSGFAWSESSPLAQQATQAGARRVLGKPFRPHELLQAIKDVLPAVRD